MKIPYAKYVPEFLSLLRVAVVGFLSALLLCTELTQAQTEQVLYRFAGVPDGETPNGSLVMDRKGNLYGTTFAGGSTGQGTAFRITPAGVATVLHSFTGGLDGIGPAAGLLRIGSKFYGTAFTGGANSVGTVFAMTPTGHQTTLASLSSGDGGGYPTGLLVQGKDGNLYGTNTGFAGIYGNGGIFKVTPGGIVTMLYIFAGGTDGFIPNGDLMRDSEGNLYGTTYGGGASGHGTVFKLSPGGENTVLYSFSGGADGSLPSAGLTRDSNGNLYGTTSGGGLGYGTVFKVTPNGQESVLHTFHGRDGAYPNSGLVLDPQGNLFGSTYLGGRRLSGVLFELTATGKLKVLHTFRGGKDGANPYGGLLRDGQGNLYGTTYAGGNPTCIGGCGIVFKLIP